MERKNTISQEILRNLSATPKQHTHQRTNYNPPPAPEPTPPKKSFWSRARDKAKAFGCKAKEVCESVAEGLAPVTKLITRVTKLILATLGLLKAFEKAFA